MEDYSAEEEESWYDHQDLEQGERGGEGSCVRSQTPGHYPIVGRYHLERAGLDLVRPAEHDAS